MRGAVWNVSVTAGLLLVAVSIGVARAEQAVAAKTEAAILGLFCKGVAKDNVGCDHPDDPDCRFLLDSTYPIFADGKQYIIASYENECIGHADNFGGSVLILAEKERPWVLESDNPGDRPREECVVVRSPSGSDSLYCLYFYQQGDITRLVEHYAVVNGKLVVDNLRYREKDLIANDNSSASYSLDGRYKVDCSQAVGDVYFWFDNLRLGPSRQSLMWDVIYIDAWQVKRLCRMPLSVTEGGYKYAALPQRYARRGRFLYNLLTGSFYPILKRYN